MKIMHVRRWLPTLAWIGLISYLSTDSFSDSWSAALVRQWMAFLNLSAGAHGVDLVDFSIRKFAHVSEFFVLGVLLSRALSFAAFDPENPEGLETHITLARVLLLGFAIAVLDELHQGFTLTRGPSFLDVGWDFAGVLFSQLMIWAQSLRTVARDFGLRLQRRVLFRGLLLGFGLRCQAGETMPTKVLVTVRRATRRPQGVAWRSVDGPVGKAEPFRTNERRSGEATSVQSSALPGKGQ